jgi:hypothetical protein
VKLYRLNNKINILKSIALVAFCTIYTSYSWANATLKLSFNESGDAIGEVIFENDKGNSRYTRLEVQENTISRGLKTYKNSQLYGSLRDPKGNPRHEIIVGVSGDSTESILLIFKNSPEFIDGEIFYEFDIKFPQKVNATSDSFLKGFVPITKVELIEHNKIEDYKVRFEVSDTNLTNEVLGKAFVPSNDNAV